MNKFISVRHYCGDWCYVALDKIAWVTCCDSLPQYALILFSGDLNDGFRTNHSVDDVMQRIAEATERDE